jgi:hypothetical protein
VSESSQGGELSGAEPMLRATSSSVLRSSGVGSDDAEGPGRNLAHVVNSWPELPAAFKAAILAIIGSNEKEGR